MNAPMPPDERDDTLLIPPASVEAEQAVLGGLMLDNRAFDHISDLLREGDFYRADHRLIWSTAVRLIEKGAPADVITVYEALQAAGEEVDLSYLNDLAQNTPSAANIKGYADIVKERALRRGLLQIAHDAMRAANGSHNGRTVAELVADVESSLARLAEAGYTGDTELPTMAESLAQVRTDLQARMEAPEGLSGVSTGLAQIDEKTDGLQRGDLIVVAGRASMGKTALGMQIAQNIALDGGVVQIFSMEMSRNQLVRRMVSSLMRIPGEAMKRGRLSTVEVARFEKGQEKLETCKIFIDDRSALNIMQMRARCKRQRRAAGKLDLVVVDYLQLATSRAEQREQQVSEISRGLKALAKEMHCPVIALSQLNRGVEQRADKRPMMSDLRESGAIEQDADVIMLLYRDEYYNPDTEDKGLIEINIGKQRDGAVGRVLAAWHGEFTRVEDTDQRWRQPKAPRHAPSKSFAETY